MRATIYGSDAIGGVINIITRPDQGTTSTSPTLGAGLAAASGCLQQRQPGKVMRVIKVAGGFDDETGYTCTPSPGVNDGDKHGHRRGHNAMVDYQQALASTGDLFGTTRWFRNIAQYDRSSVAAWGPGVPSTQRPGPENQSYSRLPAIMTSATCRAAVPSPNRWMPTTTRYQRPRLSSAD